MAERVWTRLIGRLLSRRRAAEPVEEPQPEDPQPEPVEEPGPEPERWEADEKPTRPDYTDGP